MKRVAFLFSVLLLVIVACPCLGQPWCANMDFFTTSVDGGVITITHNRALYNCCPDLFMFSIEQQDSLITVLETEILIAPICTCVCCYDLPVSVGPCAPGQYRIEYSWQDYESGPRTEVLNVTVPDQGQTVGSTRFDVWILPPACQHDPPVGVDPDGPADPGATGEDHGLRLVGCRPNPTHDVVHVEYEARVAGRVRLEVFTAGGTRVRVLTDDVVSAGGHRVTWDGRDGEGTSVPTGVYFLRLSGEGASCRQRLVLVR